MAIRILNKRLIQTVLVQQIYKTGDRGCAQFQFSFVHDVETVDRRVVVVEIALRIGLESE